MVKLLIADDENFTRNGIIDMLPWVELNVTEIKDAFDGQHALEILEDFEPDILLTDVRMPRINGIELAYKVRNRYPNCAIIFMSGYSDKEYLKSAIHLKAINYVEKPLELDELEDTLKTAISELQKNKAIQTKLENSIALELIETCDSETIKSILQSHYTEKICEDLLNDSFISLLITTKDSLLLPNEIMFNKLREIICLYKFNSLISLKSNKEILIHLNFKKSENTTSINNELTSLLYSIKEYVNTISPHYIIVGEVSHSIFNLAFSYKTIQSACNQIFFYDYNSIIFYNEPQNNFYTLPSDFYTNFEDGLNNEDKQQLCLLLKKLTLEIKDCTFTSISYIRDIYYNCIIRIMKYSQLRKLKLNLNNEDSNYLDNIIKFNNIYEINNYVLELIEILFNELEKCNENITPAHDIIQYINDNYFNAELSLDDISKNIFLTPAYICVIFKEHTGKTVNKYLTEYRIDRAKDLLKDKNIKMSDIALKIGFRDGNYFAKTFKKETGFSPSDFRRRFS